MAYKYLKNIIPGLFSIKAILILRLLFGYYSEVFSSKVLCKLARIYTFSYFAGLLTCLAFFIYSSPSEVFVEFSYPLLLQLLISMIISQYIKEKAFLKFCTNIKTIDKVIGLKSKQNVKFTGICMWFCLISKFLSEIPVMRFYNLSDFSTIWYPILLLGIMTDHLSHVTRTATLELFWSRIKHITEDLKIKCYDKDFSNEDKIFILKRFLHHYKHILDNFSDTNKSLKFGMFFNVIFLFIAIIVCINIGIVTLIDERLISVAINVVVEIALNVISTLSSALLAEMILCEYDQIKETLGNLVLKCTDYNFREMIYDAIEYIETRPPKYTIWRIFPIDISLVIGLVELSATYVIIFLQL